MRTARSLTMGRCTCPGGVPTWWGVPAWGVYLPGVFQSTSSQFYIDSISQIKLHNLGKIPLFQSRLVWAKPHSFNYSGDYFAKHIKPCFIFSFKAIDFIHKIHLTWASKIFHCARQIKTSARK